MLAVGFAMLLAQVTEQLLTPASAFQVRRTSAILRHTSPSTSTLSPAETVEPKMDRFGNQIENALGDYRVDERGNIYETHSPETAVTILRAPGT